MAGRLSKDRQGRALAAAAALASRRAFRPLGLPRLLAGGMAELRACLAQEVEERRLFLWLPVGFGLGILLFFQAEGEPALWAPLIGIVAAAGAAYGLRARLAAFAAAVFVAAMFAGFAAALLRTRAVEAPRLTRVVIAPMAGFIDSIEERSEGARILVRLHDLAGVEASRRPKLVRVTLRDGRGLNPGDYILVKARLLPPPEPARPGGYDFARDAYYRGIGAVGSILGKPQVVPPPVPPDAGLRWAAAVDAARNALTRRIADAIGGQAGAVGAALVTGKRGLIDEDTNDDLRAAGIYHIVSISGLHMVLAAGVFFWITRGLMALSPHAALLWPVKKIAALVAMAGATAYCIFSGSDVATERSLVMILIMLGAILADRPVLSMRNLATSALVVLAREPESLLGPSFQMSYGAVAALILLAGAMASRLDGIASQSRVGRAMSWLRAESVGMLATTFVASLATAPFSAYHFQTANPFGLLGNALTLPLISVVVMPAAVFGVITYPFGLDRPIWEIMGLAVEQVLKLSGWVSGFSGSSLVVPAFSVAVLGLFVAALLFATLFASRLRWLAVLPAAAAIGLSGAPRREDVYVDRAGAGAMVRGPEGRLVALGRPSAFVLEQWLKADGDPREADHKSVRTGARCDRLGCVVETSGGRAVSVVLDRAGFLDDCRRAAVVISRLRAPAGCAAPILIDRDFLDRHGATTVRFAPTPEVTSTRRPAETRPWLKEDPAPQASPPPPPDRTAPGQAAAPSARRRVPVEADNPLHAEDDPDGSWPQ